MTRTLRFKMIPALIGLGFFYLGTQLATLTEAPKLQPRRTQPTQVQPSPQEAFEAQEAFLQKRIEERPNTISDRIALANLYLGEARRSAEPSYYDDAELFAKTILIEYPHHIQSRIVLAEVFESRHQFADALEVAEKVLKDKPGSLSAVSIQVTSNLALGNLTEALSAANKLVQERPLSGSFAFRALVQIARGNDKEAENDFRRSFAIEESFDTGSAVWTRCLYSRFLMERGRHSEAIKFIDEALEKRPDSHFALSLKGKFYETEGKLKMAHSYLQQAYDLSGVPHYGLRLAQVESKLGWAKLSEKRMAQLEQHVRSVNEDNQYGHPHDLVDWLLIRGEKSDVKEALNVAKADAMHRPTARSFYNLALCYFQLGDTKNAQIQMRKVKAFGERRQDYLQLANKLGV